MKTSVFFLSIIYFLFFAIRITAQEVNFNQPPNSSYLAEYGLSPQIFNTLISPMYQENLVFSSRVTIDEKYGIEKRKDEYELIYDPFYEYGLTLKLVVHDPKVYETQSKSALKKYIGKTYEDYKKIRGVNIIDEHSVGLVKDEGGQVILGFRFEKSTLPNYLKYMSEMEGRVYIQEGKLDRIEMQLTSPTKVKGIQVTTYSHIVTYERLKSGGYVLGSSTESYKGSKHGKSYSAVEKLEVVKYYDSDNNPLSEFKTDASITTNSSYKPDTLKVKLERTLPIWGNAARKAGYELPLPYGVDMFTHFQQEDLGLEKIVLNEDDLTKSILATDGSSARATTNLLALRGDVWILPFFNVTLITGYIYGTTEVTLKLSEEVKETLQLLDLQAEELTVTTDITGPMLGGGITLAGGYKNLFATVNAIYINQFVSEVNTSVDAYAITPLIGVRFPKIVNIVVGAQYQLYNSNVSGQINLEGENLKYDVELKATRWNWLVGLQRDFSNSWNGSVMYGGKPRPQATIVLGYRF